MVDSLKPIIDLTNLNTRLFLNVLEGIDDHTGQIRLDDHTNNISFIALHLLDARYYFCRLIGHNLDNPYESAFKDINRIEDIPSYPKLSEIKELWENVSFHILNNIPMLTAADIVKKSKDRFPVEDDTILGALSFLVQHESYHIGQLGLLRKHFGLEAMSYEST